MNILRKKQREPARRQRLHSFAHEGRTTSADLEERYMFRRNRTLTGSLSSGVSSVNEHRAELKITRVFILMIYASTVDDFLGCFSSSLLIIAGLGWVVFQSIALPRVVAMGASVPVDAHTCMSQDTGLSQRAFSRTYTCDDRH